MKKINYILLAMVLIVLAAPVMASLPSSIGMQQSQMVQVNPKPQMQPLKMNFTKIDITPRYGHIRLEPGESEQVTVTIKNRDKKSITITPKIVTPPYNNYIIDKEWITITPETKELGVGDSQKFTIKVSLPKNVSTRRQGDSITIAFTNETIPTPYPQPFPNYVHSFHLSVEIWTPPKVQIEKSYISGQLEAGKEYDYKIKLKNTGDKDITIKPKLSHDQDVYGPYGIMEPAFTDDEITITSPDKLPAGKISEVKIHIKVPENSKGSYHGVIDLGIDDPSIQEWSNKVRMDFEVWGQPSEPFLKNFTTDGGIITIEVSSNMFGDIMIPYPKIIQKNSDKEPSFIVNLTGPNNKEIPLNKTKTVIQGSVSLGGMGMMYPPWESDSEGVYKEMSNQLTETYSANVSAGDLKLSIMPQNTRTFRYTISMGK